MTRSEFDAMLKMEKDEIIDRTLTDLKILINFHYDEIPCAQVEELIEFRKKLKKLKFENRNEITR